MVRSLTILSFIFGAVFGGYIGVTLGSIDNISATWLGGALLGGILCLVIVKSLIYSYALGLAYIGVAIWSSHHAYDNIQSVEGGSEIFMAYPLWQFAFFFFLTSIFVTMGIEGARDSY